MKHATFDQMFNEVYGFLPVHIFDCGLKTLILKTLISACKGISLFGSYPVSI